MRIEANKYVALDYTLTLDSGEVVDQSEQGEPLAFIYGSGNIISGLERQILGLESGASAKIVVEPEEGYGVSRPELVQRLPRQHFPDDVSPGMTFEAEGEHGSMLLFVKEVAPDSVLVDMNHPLAGKRLHFALTVAEVREPTEEDLELLSGCSDDECEHCNHHH